MSTIGVMDRHVNDLCLKPLTEILNCFLNRIWEIKINL